MARTRSLEIYVNGKGRKPMSYCRKFSEEELPENEADVTKALENIVEALSDLPREIESQFVVVEGGLIVAVEGLTTRKLIWCN
jgi:hypothetical protein